MELDFFPCAVRPQERIFLGCYILGDRGGVAFWRASVSCLAWRVRLASWGIKAKLGQMRIENATFFVRRLIRKLFVIFELHPAGLEPETF